MCLSQDRSSHVIKEAVVLSLVTVLGVCAQGALAATQVSAAGGERRPDRTLVVGLQIDRAGMQVLSFTLKDRPFQGPAKPARVRPFHGVGIVQFEIRLVDNGQERFLRRVELGPLCFDHGPDTAPHIQGDTIIVHRDAFVVELPEIQDADRVEIAYYEEHLGMVSRKTLGTDWLGESRFTPAAGPFSYSDLSFAGSESGATRTALSSTGLWPEDFGDSDIYQIYGDPADGANRINIVIVPDGYTYAEKALMETHASAAVDSFRNKTPYAEHDSFINYTLVYAYSVDSGTDQCDCGVILDSAMGTRFPDAGFPCLDSENRCLYYAGAGCDTNGTANIIEAEQRAPFHDETLVMVNTTRYGGCGGARAVYSAGHSAGVEIAIHELGHSLAGLADEYAYDAACGNNGGELNTSVDPVDGAWPEWIDDLGAPREGARYYQSCIYRPLPNCAMRSLFQPFCPVCNQRWALVFFGHPRVNPTAPISSATPESPTSAEVGVPQTFTVTTRLATGVTNEIEWTLEGPGYPVPTVVATDVAQYEATFTVSGEYILQCQVTADTNFIKPEKNWTNVDTSTWIVSAIPEGATVVLEAELANLPICQDTGQDNIDVPLDVCKVYARLASIDHRLLSVGNSEITTTDPNGFFQHPLNASVIAPSCSFVGFFPDLICDSFITIGLECGPDPAGTDSTTPDGNFDPAGFALNGHVAGGWFNASPPNGQGDPGPDLRVLVAQFSVARGQTVSGTLSAFVRIPEEPHPLIVESPYLEFVCTGGTSPCNEACPTDVDFDGQTGAFDLAFLLGCWGPVTPGGACACLDADGVVDAADLAFLLGAWGECPE